MPMRQVLALLGVVIALLSLAGLPYAVLIGVVLIGIAVAVG
jgi:hypothetical protein